jgi:hypothetical protein
MAQSYKVCVSNGREVDLEIYAPQAIGVMLVLIGPEFVKRGGP